MRIACLASILAFVLPITSGCGEHPCTLHVGEPTWCTAIPGDAAPFCGEVCGVCSEADADKWAKACHAHCREVAGIQELACEQLDAEVEATYRQCVQTEDYPGCGGHS